MKESHLTLASLKEKCCSTKLVIFDVDGVLTDRKIYFMDHHLECKAFNAFDGLGMKWLLSSNIEIGIITTRRSVAVERRMRELDVRHVYQGQENKREALITLMRKLKLSLEEVVYVGDDLPDLPLMRQVGVGIAVADAAEYVRQHADWVTKTPGGKGVAREVSELVLSAQGKLAPILKTYLS